MQFLLPFFMLLPFSLLPLRNYFPFFLFIYQSSRFLLLDFSIHFFSLTKQQFPVIIIPLIFEITILTLLSILLALHFRLIVARILFQLLIYAFAMAESSRILHLHLDLQNLFA